jgi:flagellar biosynthesis protein FliR
MSVALMDWGFTTLGAFAVQTLLVSVRLLPLLVVLPVTIFARIPVHVRVILALTFAAVLAAGLAPDPALKLTPATLATEFLAGMVMAFGVHVAVAALDMVGRLIDLQIGLNASGVFDPATSNVVGIVAEFLSLGFLMLFVALDLHHVLLRAIAQMLVLLPPGQSPMALVSPEMGSLLGRQFLSAFLLASPIIIGLFLTDVAFAFLSRSMPQANVYFLALPVKIGVGLVLLMFSLPVILQGMTALFGRAVDPYAMEAVRP